VSEVRKSGVFERNVRSQPPRPTPPPPRPKTHMPATKQSNGIEGCKSLAAEVNSMNKTLVSIETVLAPCLAAVQADGWKAARCMRVTSQQSSLPVG